MYQIDVPTASLTLPAPVAGGFTPGYFTGGNPGLGIPFTELPAEFMNAVMLELLNVVGGGGITPDQAQNNQVFLAIGNMIATAITAVTAAVRVPVGVSVFHNSSIVPAGWYQEDGVTITRAGDPDLWAFAQVSGQMAADGVEKAAHPFMFGPGDGATTFDLPDKRGLFVRVWDDGAGRNPGRALGSYEASQNLEHGHTVPIYGNDAGTLGISTSDLGSGLPVVSTSLEGGSEARPRSGASMSIIKR